MYLQSQNLAHLDQFQKLAGLVVVLRNHQDLKMIWKMTRQKVRRTRGMMLEITTKISVIRMNRHTI